MFRKRAQGESVPLESLGLSRYQQRRLVDSWAVMFREKILPLLREEDFAHFYHESTGAPNTPVQIVLGILLLKEMFDLSDPEALERFAFDLRWHVALDVVGKPLSCCQKTLHNFRVRLRQHQASANLFNDIVTGLKDLLGLDTSRQRLDSTHARSNAAILSRLGLFCESFRLFFRRLLKEFPDLFALAAPQLRRRYADEQGDARRFDRADRRTGKRRLSVACRDLQRLLDFVAAHQDLQEWPESATLHRLLKEQCQQTDTPNQPQADEEDAALGPVGRQLLQPKEIASFSLQTPHDPDVTYGNKGQGYEVQIVETFGNKTQEEPDKPELITFVDVTPSCKGDGHITIEAIKDLKARDLQPAQLEADTAYTSAKAVEQARQLGTDLNGPVPGNKSLPGGDEVTVGDFKVDFEQPQNSRCPAGHALHSQTVVHSQKACEEKPAAKEEEAPTRRVSLAMLAAVCAVCQLEGKCPIESKKQTKQEVAKQEPARRVLQATAEELLNEQRRRFQTTAEYKERYRNRAGCEATNSEAKRAHGLGKLSVRGAQRVKQAVLFKLAACNIKRVVHYLARVAKRSP
jgi:Transposase DDE domain/Transposase domain (DUF772)